jgi:hypothetical protein
MPREPVTRLQAARGPTPDDADVIDAKFTEVGGKYGHFWRRVRTAAIALFWAAVIGFLIPPVWVLVQRLHEQGGAP